MADVIEFGTNTLLEESSSSEETITLSAKVLEELLKNVNSIEDLMICVKLKNSDMELFHTGLALKDRSYIVQVISADIQAELNESLEDMDLDEDE